MAQEEFYDHFLSADLIGKPAEADFVLVRRGTHGQLIAERFGKPASHANGRRIVDFRAGGKPECFTQLIFIMAVHADEQTALSAVAARPLMDRAVEQSPSPKIEISHAEIGTV